MAAFSRRYGRKSRGGARLCILGPSSSWPWRAVDQPGQPFRLAGKPLSPPFGESLFGTDTLGRDVAAGITHGRAARHS